jgi:anaerobic selenocysteine-containing dehydrogenase
MNPAQADRQIIAGEAALPAVIPNEYEYRNDYEIFRGLGVRLGQEEYWPWKTIEEVCDYRLEPLDMTLKEFMERKNGIHIPLNFTKGGI